MNAVETLFPGEQFHIRSLGKTVEVRPWSVRMVLKDIPAFLDRAFAKLNEKGGETELSSILSVVGEFSDDVLYLISKSVRPNLELEELYEMPAGECARLLETILKVNEDFFAQLGKVLARFRGERKEAPEPSET